MYNLKAWRKYKLSSAYRYQVKRNKKVFNRVQNAAKQYGQRSLDVSNNTLVNLEETEIVAGYNEVEMESVSEDLPRGDVDFETDKINLREELKTWALQFNITHQALQQLLILLRKSQLSDEGLPKDPRTLLDTPINRTLYPLGNGSYWHQGLKNCLIQYFNGNLDKSMNISLNFNIDGLPIYNSSVLQFWPILFNISEIKDFRPMVIGIYCGRGKPSILTDYLRLFVDECKDLLENGILVNGHKLNIKLRSFICDSPARAFIKGVAYYNSKHGCLKCTVVGEYISHCTVFLHTQCENRTDDGFRKKVYDSHHKLSSILEELPIDMVEDFPIGDSLHLIDLGIVKKCLTSWTKGDFKGTDIRFSMKDINCISIKLCQIRLPIEIHRMTRGLDCLSYWKGTEYRTFLYYTGIVVLKDYLRYDAYEHFLTFFCAITICSNNNYKHFFHLAKILLEQYIEKYVDLYKKHSITSNVHNLCHLADEVKRFGILSSFNAYPFENLLYTLKNMLRTGSNPLAQAANRIVELSKHNKYCATKSNNYPILKNRNQDKSYNKIVFENFMLNNKMSNKRFLTTNNSIVGLENITQQNTQTIIKGIPLQHQVDFFLTPIKSSRLNIYIATYDEGPLSLYQLNDIKCKLVAVPYNNDQGVVFIPLIHTL